MTRAGTRLTAKHSERGESAFAGRGTLAHAEGASLDILALQRSVGNDAVHRLLSVSTLPAAADSVTAALPSDEGQALDPRTRAFMEGRFGTDLGDVRIHDDRNAQAMAETLSADAYTLGSHVVFGPGRYAPEQASGRGLLAHELAHVIQQRGAGTPTGVVPAGSPVERAADAAAAQAASGTGPVDVAAAGTAGLAMKGKDEKLSPDMRRFLANRSFETTFSSMVPPGWPYTDELRRLWEATKAHWSYDPTTKKITPIDENRAAASARPFVQKVREIQISLLGRGKVPMKRTGTDDPVGVAQQPPSRAVGQGSGSGGGDKTGPAPPKGGSTAPGGVGTSGGSGAKKPVKPSSRGVPVKNVAQGRAANDNDVDARKREVAEQFEEAQGLARPQDAAADAAQQNVSKIPGAKQPPKRATGGTWAHDNYESLDKVLKPNADSLVRQPLPRNLEKEHRIPVPGVRTHLQPRADRVDWKAAEVIEIKPSNLKELGEVEAKGYADMMNKYEKRTDGKVWTGRCVTYDEAKVMKFLDDIGYFEKPKPKPPKGKK